MSRQWKPGDVALVHWTTSQGNRRLDRVARSHRHGWVRHDEVFVHDDKVNDAHPLVVIDPEDREQVERLTGALVQAAYDDGNFLVSDQGIHGDTTQAALRSLVAPPKPDEPTDSSSRVSAPGGFPEWARVATPFGPRWVTDGGVGITWDELVRDHPDVEVQR